MANSTEVPRTRRIVQVADLSGPAPLPPPPPPPPSYKHTRNPLPTSTLASPSPSKKARHDLAVDPLGEWANDLDVFSYRFETVVAEWKKSRGKLRDLEAARGPPPPSGPGKTNANSTANGGNGRKSAASINPFFLLLPPTAKISPSSLVLVFFAADHMLHSSPTGLAGAQRFVQVYEGGRHKAAQNQANGHGPGNGGSAVARQNAVMTELIYSALGWLGVKGGGLAGVPASVAGFVGTDHVEPSSEEAASSGSESRGRSPEEAGRTGHDGPNGSAQYPAASNGHPPLPTQPPPPFHHPVPSTDPVPAAKGQGLGARIRHIALSPTRLFRPSSSSSTSPTSPASPNTPTSVAPASSAAPPQPSSATLAAPLLSRSSSQSGILANPTTSQYQQHHRITASSSPTPSIHSTHARPSSPLAPTPSAVAPPVLCSPILAAGNDEGQTARDRVPRRANSNSPEAVTTPLPPGPKQTSPDTYSSSLPSERPHPGPASTSTPSTPVEPVATSGRRSLLGRVHHRSARMLSASGITLPPLPGQPAAPQPGSSIFGDKFSLPAANNASAVPAASASTSTSPPTADGAAGGQINFFFTPFPTAEGGGGAAGGQMESEQSLMQAKKFRGGGGAVRSGSGPVKKPGAGESAVGGGLPFPLAAAQGKKEGVVPGSFVQ